MDAYIARKKTVGEKQTPKYRELTADENETCVIIENHRRFGQGV
jgi:hypothetical protein